MAKEGTNIRKDTEALALPQGRRVGQEGHDVARTFLLGRMGEIGLDPFRGEGFELPFRVDSMDGTNLIGRIRGKDSSLPPVLVGAHYDSVIDAPCADDNATAVAVVLAVAEHVRPGELERDLVIAVFDAEEPPYFLTPAMGSTRFYEDHCRDTGFACVIVMDLIGHDVDLHHPAGNLLAGVAGLKKLLFVLGAESAPQLPDIVRNAAHEISGLKVVPTLNRYIGDMSDHHAFRLGGEPFLFLSCGQGRHYHRPSDDLRWINFAKVDRVFHLVAALVRGVDGTEVHAEDHDPVEFEIEMITRALGPVLPLLHATGLPPLRAREDLDSLVSVLAGNLGNGAGINPGKVAPEFWAASRRDRVERSELRELDRNEDAGQKDKQIV